MRVFILGNILSPMTLRIGYRPCFYVATLQKRQNKRYRSRETFSFATQVKRAMPLH